MTVAPAELTVADILAFAFAPLDAARAEAEGMPLCGECCENPVLVDDLWGELEVCEECNDGTPDDPADVTTPGEVWEV
ncbi:hypothetical protein [Nocardiopsis sp. LOL_012]|uniref:hypothetical protein n=1 Tax=Nocardiopsis sp. LOL_012 TaxID=3345409 RepID=UPI003A892612